MKNMEIQMSHARLIHERAMKHLDQQITISYQKMQDELRDRTYNHPGIRREGIEFFTLIPNDLR